MFPDNFSAVQITNSSFTVRNLKLWNASLLQFLAGAALGRSLQKGTPHKSLAPAACHQTLILLAWLGGLFQFSKHLSSRDVFILIWIYWCERLKNISDDIWIFHQYQTLREIKEIGEVCLLIYKVMVYLNIRMTRLEIRKQNKTYMNIVWSYSSPFTCLAL